jgi:hypothetical protein
MNPVENEIKSAIRYGLSANASRSEVFSARSVGFAAIEELRNKNAPEIAEIASIRA